MYAALFSTRSIWCHPFALIAALFLGLVTAVGAQAQELEFRQTVAQSSVSDEDLVAFYRERNFEGIWIGRDDRVRRNALLAAFSAAGDHGLPIDRYDPDALTVQLQAAKTPQALGELEVTLSRLFLQYARDVQTGILVPSRVDNNIKREVPYRSRLSTIQAFARSNPASFIRSLPPSSPEYTRLMREKLVMERVLAVGAGCNWRWCRRFA